VNRTKYAHSRWTKVDMYFDTFMQTQSYYSKSAYLTDERILLNEPQKKAITVFLGEGNF
jgi:hypothetical protein